MNGGFSRVSRSATSKATPWVAALLAVLLLGQGNPVKAQERSAAADMRTYAPVQVEGRTLFEVTGNNQLSSMERADRINRRLQNLITRPVPVPPFTPANVRERGREWLITLGGEPIAQVTPADAEDTLAEPHELALLWGGKLATAVEDARATRANPFRGAGILIRNAFRDLVVSALTWLPRLAGALVLLIFFSLLARLVTWCVRAVAERTAMDGNLRQLLRAVAFYGTWLVGGAFILSTLGFQSGSIVTALGVSGFVLGFSFKDILSHFLAGLMLLTGRQFRIGDQIMIKEFEGTVERIELRALHLRTYDNRLVIIPNAEVFTSAVTSNTASPHRRRDFLVGIGYEAPVNKARKIALETVRATPGVLAEPEPDVLVDELAASTSNLRTRFYTSSLRSDYLKVGSACMQRVKEAFEQQGISMPTDIQTVVLQNAAH